MPNKIDEINQKLSMVVTSLKGEHMSFYEKISIIRKLHEHEDLVKNHRMMWMLTLQAFLFTAIFVALGTKGWIANTIFPIILSFFGLVSCISINASVRCSLKAIDNINKVSNALFCGEKDQEKPSEEKRGISFFKAMIGKVDFDLNKCEKFLTINLGNNNENILPWNLLPKFLILVWIIFLIIFFIHFFHIVFVLAPSNPKLLSPMWWTDWMTV